MYRYSDQYSSFSCIKAYFLPKTYSKLSKCDKVTTFLEI